MFNVWDVETATPDGPHYRYIVGTVKDLDIWPALRNEGVLYDREYLVSYHVMGFKSDRQFVYSL